MKPLSFYSGIGVAFGLGLAGSILYSALTPLLGGAPALRMLIALLGLCYLIYLLRHNAERSGRVTAMFVWLVVAGASWLYAPSLTLYCLIHTGLIWLLRCFYFYHGVMPALLDLGLSAFGLAAALWAITWSGSVFLAIWCFFLVQSLFVSIPRSLHRRTDVGQTKTARDERFQRAYRDAENAIRRITSNI